MEKIRDQQSEAITYFFNRSKDIHEENGRIFITLFVRLTREFTRTDGWEVHKKTETVWVNIEERKLEHAKKKMQALPNGIRKYQVSKEVFKELHKTAVRCPEELYYLTPFSTAKRKSG